MQNNVTETKFPAHVKDTVSKTEVALADVAEDVDTVQPEENARHIEVGATTTYTEIARTQKESARCAKKVTKK